MKNIKLLGLLVFVILSCTRFEDPTIGLSNKVELVTTKVTVISSDTALFEGNILKDGNDGITERGFAYHTSAKPKITNKIVKSGLGIGFFSTKATDLLPNTPYFVAAYAINKLGAVYGADLSFSTPKSPPRLSPTLIASFTPYGAVVSSNILLDGGSPITERGICWSSTPGANIKNNKIPSSNSSNSFDTPMTNLSPGGTYYVRSYAINGIGEGYGQETILKTLDIKPPSLDPNCLPATFIGYNEATINANITNDGLSNKLETGIILSLSSNSSDLKYNGVNAVTAKSSLTTSGKISILFNNLNVGTKYYYVSYAKNEAAIVYSPMCSFSTNDYTAPVVDQTCMPATSVGVDVATISGNVVGDGGIATLEKGFILSSTNTNLTYQNNNSQTLVSSEKVKGSYSYVINSLKPKAKYYYKSYSLNSKGITYGALCEFTTNDYGAPKFNVTCIDPTDITKTTAKIYAEVIDDGGDSKLEKGIILGNNSSLIYSKGGTNTFVSSGVGKGPYSFIVSNLVAGSTNFYRPYAINGSGNLVYGPICQFITSSYDKPSIGTSCIAPSRIGFTYAYVEGNLVNWGGDDYGRLTERGAIWSNTLADISASVPKGTSNTSAWISGTGTGQFSVGMDNLTPGTVYYYRIYAKNIAGTSYGPVCSIVTQNYSLPVFLQTCIPTSSLSHNSVSLKSDTFDDGGNKSDYGFLLSEQSTNLTISNTSAIYNQNITVGYYRDLTATITGLKASTTYYYRAYITNSAGTGYGKICSFTTNPPQLPTVVTGNVANLLSLSATLIGNISNDGGGAITERGFVWSTNSNFTNPTTVLSSSTSYSFSAVLSTTSTNKGIRYYRAFAKNSSGYGFGGTVSFTFQ